MRRRDDNPRLALGISDVKLTKSRIFRASDDRFAWLAIFRDDAGLEARIFYHLDEPRVKPHMARLAHALGVTCGPHDVQDQIQQIDHSHLRGKRIKLRAYDKGDRRYFVPVDESGEDTR